MRIEHLTGLLGRDQSGAAVVEFAIVAPVLAAMLIGLVDLSMYISSTLSVERAARAGGEYAVVRGFDATNIATAVTAANATRGSYMSAIAASPAPSSWCGCPSATTGVSAATCGTNCASGLKAGTYVTARASATFTPLFPWPGMSGRRQLSAASTVRIE